MQVRLFLLLAACGAPFSAVRPASQASGVSVSFCGASKINSLRRFEPPSDLPTEVGGSGGLEPPQEVSFCLLITNRGAATARFDRGDLELKCPSEKQQWVPDKDDQEVIVRAGESKELHVGFHYSPLQSGEDVTLLFEKALTISGRFVRLPPLPLRKN